ncbi:MAG TPA: hypothetical protein VL173_08560 [Vicinamibacterales bacterium]|nr:hypothetical protein [Vicinamibacterales bacterium]
MSQLQHLPQQLAAFRSEVDVRFAAVDARFAEIDKRFDRVDARFAEIDKRFDRVDTRFAEIDKRFDQVEARFVQMDARFDDLSAQMRTLFEEAIARINVVTEERGPGRPARSRPGNRKRKT